VAKAASWTNTDAEERKPGEQTGLDTPVVLALNDECLVWRGSIPAVPELTHLAFRLGRSGASLKRKGIDRGPHKRGRMWVHATAPRQPSPSVHSERPPPKGTFR